MSAPFVYWFMPTLIRIGLKPAYVPAANAARLMLLAGVVGFVFAWTKSLPVSIGRPGLRIVTHGIETLVLIPLVLTLGSLWDATGAAAAALIATGVFAVAWLLALMRIYREHGTTEVVPS